MSLAQLARPWMRLRPLQVASVALCLSLVVTRAQARLGGIAAPGCDACHQGARIPTVTLTSDPPNPAIGEAITLTIRVSNASGSSAGFYLTTAHQAPGMFQAVESGTAATASEVTHTAPRVGMGGSTTFAAQWIPTQASGVQFDVYAVSADGDRSSRGDSSGTGSLEVVVGCAGTTYYIDQDGDGYGSSDPAYRPRKDCSPPAGYADMAGDCDDFRASVHPGAVEQCDLKDNDCDGNADEDVVDQAYCEDQDGDGYGVMGGATKVDCKPSAGFGDCVGDCDDRDDRRYPGAEEVCDGWDNDCDGDIDEGVRGVCGVGLCARFALSCSSTCTPGLPFDELCNGYDDDCDGVVDDGDNEQLCGSANTTCVGGLCQSASPQPGAAGASTGGAPAADPTGAPNKGSAARPASCSLRGVRTPALGVCASAALLAGLILRRRMGRFAPP
jgi:Putative metal-binding motif